MTGTHISDEQWREIIRHYLSGDSISTVARRYSRSPSAIRVGLSSRGVVLRSVGRPPGSQPKAKLASAEEPVKTLADDGLVWVRKGLVMVAVPIEVDLPEDEADTARAAA